MKTAEDQWYQPTSSKPEGGRSDKCGFEEEKGWSSKPPRGVLSALARGRVRGD